MLISMGMSVAVSATDPHGCPAHIHRYARLCCWEMKATVWSAMAISSAKSGSNVPSGAVGDGACWCSGHHSEWVARMEDVDIIPCWVPLPRHSAWTAPASRSFGWPGTWADQLLVPWLGIGVLRRPLLCKLNSERAGINPLPAAGARAVEGDVLLPSCGVGRLRQGWTGANPAAPCRGRRTVSATTCIGSFVQQGGVDSAAAAAGPV